MANEQQRQRPGDADEKGAISRVTRLHNQQEEMYPQ